MSSVNLTVGESTRIAQETFEKALPVLEIRHLVARLAASTFSKVSTPLSDFEVVQETEFYEKFQELSEMQLLSGDKRLTECFSFLQGSLKLKIAFEMMRRRFQAESNDLSRSMQTQLRDSEVYYKEINPKGGAEAEGGFKKLMEDLNSLQNEAKQKGLALNEYAEKFFNHEWPATMEGIRAIWKSYEQFVVQTPDVDPSPPEFVAFFKQFNARIS